MDTINDGPSENFVELEALAQNDNGTYEWKEKARWIELEEDVEEGSNRWSKPYVPTISYMAIQSLKEYLQEGHVLLDVEADSLAAISEKVCTCLLQHGNIDSGFIPTLYAMLLARRNHKHQKQQDGGEVPMDVVPTTTSNVEENVQSGDAVTVNIVPERNNGRKSSKNLGLLQCMSKRAEATSILVVNVSYTRKPIVLFVRLQYAALLGNLNEIQIPVRFVYLVIGPRLATIACFQVGRAIGTLMSDENFAKLAAHSQTKSDILSGVQTFLLSSTILPCRKWDLNALQQSISKWIDNSKVMNNFPDNKRYKASAVISLLSGLAKAEDDPLRRTGRLFGGLVEDVKRKIPHFKSDYLDALNLRCLVTIIFIYVSFLAPAITFAVLLSKSTKGLMGISEMIAATTVSGVIFGIFAGQPLIILGATGPMLVMEESIYGLAMSLNLDFLCWRFWIGIWITVFCTIIVALDLSFLVRKFTLFTEEVVTALISMVFIYESFQYIWKMFDEFYYPTKFEDVQNEVIFHNATNITVAMLQKHQRQISIPFITIILMIGTFLTCHYIRIVRHSQYFPSRLRRLLSDFGISLAVFLFILFDRLMEDDYTPKLEMSNGFKPTSPLKRNWVIHPLGSDDNKLSALSIIFASLPALLVTIILFMETELTGTIVDRKEYKLKKGSGYNLDLLIVGLLATFCSVFGLPWMCACPIHSISHLNSLTIWNLRKAPGTQPTVQRVIEQRATNIVIHLLIGLTIFLAPLLREIPISVVYGVFLYLGITALSHLKLTQRIKLLFIHSKHHPDYRYIRKVKTYKIHIFTAIQLACLALVLGIKNTEVAPLFPLFIVLMVPIRHLLKRFYTEEELEELDSDTEDLNDDSLDVYDVVHVPM